MRKERFEVFSVDRSGEVNSEWSIKRLKEIIEVAEKQ